jgi:hypothetical protein
MSRATTAPSPIDASPAPIVVREPQGWVSDFSAHGSIPRRRQHQIEQVIADGTFLLDTSRLARLHRRHGIQAQVDRSAAPYLQDLVLLLI